MDGWMDGRMGGWMNGFKIDIVWMHALTCMTSTYIYIYIYNTECSKRNQGFSEMLAATV